VSETVTLTPDEQRLYECLPEDGGTVSNAALQAKLDLDESAYWTIRDALVDRSIIARGRGRGGTIRRVLNESPPTVEFEPISIAEEASRQAAQAEATISRELELYEPMKAVIQGDWAKDRRSTPLSVEITALQGRRATGGTWSRPDVVSVEVRTFEYVPGKFLELTTFEVKPADAINVQAVYEALAHRRAATRSYVLLHVPSQCLAAEQEKIDDLCSVARSHGIGVITAIEPHDYASWEELADAQRYEPDPERLDRFISTQLSEETRRKIARALR
jgi:hypothetical protein